VCVCVCVNKDCSHKPRCARNAAIVFLKWHEMEPNLLWEPSLLWAVDRILLPLGVWVQPFSGMGKVFGKSLWYMATVTTEHERHWSGLGAS
jgi:hypothetical protein